MAREELGGDYTVKLPPFGAIGFRGFVGTVGLVIQGRGRATKGLVQKSLEIKLDEGRPLPTRFLAVECSRAGFRISTGPKAGVTTNAVVFHVAGFPIDPAKSPVTMNVRLRRKGKIGNDLVSKGQMQDSSGVIEVVDPKGVLVAEFTVLPYSARPIESVHGAEFGALPVRLHELDIRNRTKTISNVHVGDPVMVVGPIEAADSIYGLQFRRRKA